MAASRRRPSAPSRWEDVHARSSACLPALTPALMPAAPPAQCGDHPAIHISPLLPAVLQDAAGKKSAKARPAAVDKENEAALKVLSAAAAQAQQRQRAAEQAAAAAAKEAAAEAEAVVVPTSRLEKHPLAALTNRCRLEETSPPGQNAHGA